LKQTNWSNLSSTSTVKLTDQEGWPDTNALFRTLQEAKFDPSFWKQLSVRDALRLDYKRFTTASGTASFGSSSVLLSLDDFLHKPNVQETIQQYMKELDLEWYVVLLSKNGSPRRQMMLCTTKSTQDLEGLEGYLLSQELLQLSRRDDDLSTDQLQIGTLDQWNVKATRKQVAPILLKYFESQRIKL
jgi:exopolyphosphatase